MNTPTSTHPETTDEQDHASVETPHDEAQATPGTLIDDTTAHSADEAVEDSDLGGWAVDEPTTTRGRKWVTRLLVALVVIAAAVGGAGAAAAYLKGENDALLEDYRQLGVKYDELGQDYDRLEGDLKEAGTLLSELSERAQAKKEG